MKLIIWSLTPFLFSAGVLIGFMASLQPEPRGVPFNDNGKTTYIQVDKHPATNPRNRKYPVNLRF